MRLPKPWSFTDQPVISAPELGLGFTWRRREKSHGSPKEVSHLLRSPNMPIGWQSSWSLGQGVRKPKYVSTQRGLSRGLVITYEASKPSDPP